MILTLAIHGPGSVRPCIPKKSGYHWCSLLKTILLISHMLSANFWTPTNFNILVFVLIQFKGSVRRDSGPLNHSGPSDATFMFHSSAFAILFADHFRRVTGATLILTANSTSHQPCYNINMYSYPDGLKGYTSISLTSTALHLFLTRLHVSTDLSSSCNLPAPFRSNKYHPHCACQNNSGETWPRIWLPVWFHYGSRC